MGSRASSSGRDCLPQDLFGKSRATDTYTIETTRRKRQRYGTKAEAATTDGGTSTTATSRQSSPSLGRGGGSGCRGVRRIGAGKDAQPEPESDDEMTVPKVAMGYQPGRELRKAS